jgi:hypothetical protein
MHTTRLAASVVLLVCASVASAQQPIDVGSASGAGELSAPRPASELFVQPDVSLTSVTPEIWLYTQAWRRHDDPAQAVRRKAEARAEQRMQRIAALKWYGFSNARPQASVTPFMGIYSPAWVGNGDNRYDWVGGYPSVLLSIESAAQLR